MDIKNIKEIASIDDEMYLRGELLNHKIIFKVPLQSYSLKEVEELCRNVYLEERLLNYFSADYILSNKLTVYYLDIDTRELSAENFNLYVYEKLIKGIDTINDALKTAYICSDKNDFSIMLMSGEISLNENNIRLINREANNMYLAIEKFSGQKFTHHVGF